EKRRLQINTHTRRNEQIKADTLRVISQEGSQLGVMSRKEALEAARIADLDLVEISPNAEPPVAKIVDWGKFNYQKTKQQQRNKRNTKVSELRQMRFSLKISDHDIAVKLRKINSFLSDGDKVRVSIVYRGRELAHKDLGYKLLDKLMKQLEGQAIADQQPLFSGRQLSLVIRSSHNAKSQKP
ncbi:MAG TPA: translation initiation factor IF-3, partial [Candidatus Saccharibacteria bacterium]|nr:translation initiation factor IF-3 [Candidatus Saccharibacteria bacterium]